MLPTDSDERLKSAVYKLGVYVIECDVIQISDAAKTANMVEHWNQTFFKLNVMRLTQFKKIIYIDADMLILKNIDHLFSYPAISATTGGKAAHPEWTEFNSGLMVIEPSIECFNRLIESVEPAINRRNALHLGYETKMYLTNSILSGISNWNTILMRFIMLSAVTWMR